ncbi:angiopoietin-related protein 1-like, partial [Musca vetustissima]|uniref:angiopoietin-related protein 1-like n=1 Tax=Musca vetustissima TaxID=27455 RepID=UPI002AB7C274
IDELNKRQHEQEKDIKKILEHVSRMDVTSEEAYTKNVEILQNWTTILRRMDGSVNFYRSWSQFVKGFGNPPNGEFFIGLDKLHKLTTTVPDVELKVILKDWEGEERYAIYDGFRIADKSEKYELMLLGNYSGNAGDAMTYSKGQKFTTFDEDNDKKNDGNCAYVYKGNWWYNNCFH